MFSQSAEHSEGGSIKSFLTQQVFRYRHSPDGLDRRRAIAECEAADEPIIAAMQSRSDHPLTMREIYIDGRPSVPDTRPLGQRVREDAKPLLAPALDPDRNPWTRRLEELADVRAILPGERAQKKRMIATAKDAAEEWEIKHASEKELAAKQQAAQQHIIDAQTCVLITKGNENFTQADCDRAVARKAALEKTLDTAAYVAERDVWEAEVQTRKATLVTMSNLQSLGETL